MLFLMIPVVYVVIACRTSLRLAIKIILIKFLKVLFKFLAHFVLRQDNFFYNITKFSKIRKNKDTCKTFPFTTVIKKQIIFFLSFRNIFS